MHFNIANLQCFFLIVFTAKSKSVLLATPVERIIGLPVVDNVSINPTSVISGEATLYAGQPIFSKNSIAVRSNGEANQGNWTESRYNVW